MTLLQIGDRDPVTFRWVQDVAYAIVRIINNGILKVDRIAFDLHLSSNVLIQTIIMPPALPYTLPSVPAFIALSACYPVFIIRILTRIAQGWYIGQHDLHLLFLNRLRARLSVYKAYRTLLKRNRRKIARDGSHAICRRDRVYFRRSHAGLLPFWWCPECHDDDDAWLGVHWLRGVMDTGLNDPYKQDGHMLLINLRTWLAKDHVPARALLPQDVHIVKVADTHEPEVLIVHYNNSLQRVLKWPKLAQLACVVEADARIEELTLRQMRHTFLNVTIAPRPQPKAEPAMEKA
jgi:hypothetical protein